MKTITATEVKMNFGKFIERAQSEEFIITKNGTPLIRVNPVKKPKKELIDELFDWGVTGLKEEEVIDSMLEKYYGN